MTQANTCPNEYGIYQAMVNLEIPPHLKAENGGKYTEKTHVDIDKCLVNEIKHLWDVGIRTYGCCCGHGIDRGMINVDERDANRMVELRYEYEPDIQEGCWKYTFIPKSKHVGKE